MALTKTAITLPEDLLRGIDIAARERGESRSGFVRRVLRAALRARRDAAITRRLDELFADEVLVDEQRRTARELGLAGTRWDDESW